MFGCQSKDSAENYGKSWMIYPVNIMVFGVITHDDVMLPVIFPQGLRFNTEAYIKCFEEAVLDDPMSDSRSLKHARQSGEPSVSCEKISGTISP